MKKHWIKLLNDLDREGKKDGGLRHTDKFLFSIILTCLDESNKNIIESIPIEKIDKVSEDLYLVDKIVEKHHETIIELSEKMNDLQGMLQDLSMIIKSIAVNAQEDAEDV